MVRRWSGGGPEVVRRWSWIGWDTGVGPGDVLDVLLCRGDGEGQVGAGVRRGRVQLGSSAAGNVEETEGKLSRGYGSQRAKKPRKREVVRRSAPMERTASTERTPARGGILARREGRNRPAETRTGEKAAFASGPASRERAGADHVLGGKSSKSSEETKAAGLPCNQLWRSSRQAVDSLHREWKGCLWNSTKRRRSDRAGNHVRVGVEVVDLVSPAPLSKASSAGPSSLYGGESASLKAEQDADYDLGLAVDRSNLEQKKREEEVRETENGTNSWSGRLPCRRGPGKAQEREAQKGAVLGSHLAPEPEQSKDQNIATIVLRFPGGQRLRRRFDAHAESGRLSLLQARLG